MRRTDGTAAGSADAGRTPPAAAPPTRAADRWHPIRPSFSSGGSQATIRRKRRHAQRTQPHPNRPAHPDTHPFQSLCAAPAHLHPPQGDTPALLHGACFSTHQHTPTHTRAPSPQHAPHAPCIPLAAHGRNRHTQPARLHPPQGGTPTLRHDACFSTHQHTPEHRLHSTCPTPNAARTHRKLRLRLGPAPRAAQPQHHKPPSKPPPRPSHTDTKKGQTFRSDLEEAATYSPTGKPQYHRRE